MKLDVLVLVDVNPEPWKAPSVGRSGAYPNKQFANYQELLREEFTGLWGDRPPLVPPYQLRFWWWRELITYQAKTRMQTSRAVDQTNLQKAAEDCLQPKRGEPWTGVITNDSHCQFSGGFIVEQAKGVRPMIVVEILSEIETIGVPLFPRMPFPMSMDLAAITLRAADDDHPDVVSNELQAP